MSAIRQLRSEIQELQRWKNEMLLVESRWDKQKVGKLLGVGWGEDICPNIEPGIIKKNKEIENLRECLKEIWAITQFDWDTMPELGRKNFHKLVESMSDEALKL